MSRQVDELSGGKVRLKVSVRKIKKQLLTFVPVSLML